MPARNKPLSVLEIIRRFPDKATARARFEARVWPEGRRCPRCGSAATVALIKLLP